MVTEGPAGFWKITISKSCNEKPKEIVMLKNEGIADRIIRMVVGLGLISLVFVGPQTPWGWVGAVPLLTGLVGWCPAYSLFGIKTCRM